MRTERHPPFYLSILILIFNLLTACEDKPDFIGRDLLPSGDNFFVSFDSLEIVHGYTQHADSVRVVFRQEFLLGNITDPFFGKSAASFISTISTSTSNGAFGPNAVADSVILYMEWLDLKGEGSSPIAVNLHEFTEAIQFDSNYYSNWDIDGKYKEPPLGSVTVSWTDSTAKIDISDQEFIDKFLTAEDSILSRNFYLQELINGLYYSTNDPMDQGGMFRFNFDAGSNFLRFYYHNDTATALTQTFSLDNTTNGRIYLFSHNYSAYPVEQYLNNGSDNDSILFVQSMAGVSSVIRFPEFEHWMDSVPIAINEAKLIIPMADTNLTMQQSKYFCESLSILLVNEDGSYGNIADSWVDPGTVGGTYNAGDMTYTFTVKVQLQNILAGNSKNLAMALLPENTSQVVTRSALYGWNSKDIGRRITLEITYTLL